MILIVDSSRGHYQGVVCDHHYGVPISGASVSLLVPGTRRYLATTTSDPNGRWSFGFYKPMADAIGCVLEVVCGVEKVTIWGDLVRVEVPERRPKAVQPGHPWFWPPWAKRT